MAADESAGSAPAPNPRDTVRETAPSVDLVHRRHGVRERQAEAALAGFDQRSGASVGHTGENAAHETEAGAPGDLDHCPPEVVQVFQAAARPSSGAPEPCRFDDLISPLEVDDFYSRQWPRPRPMLMRSPPGANRFGSFLDWQSLDGIVSAAATADDVRLLWHRQGIPGELFAAQSRSGGSLAGLDDARLLSLLRQGATLVVDRAHRWHRPVSVLARAAEAATPGTWQFALCAAWLPIPAFGVGWDDHDIFAVQIRGRSRWRLFGPTRHSPLTVDIAHSRKAPPSPVWSGIVNPGDVLYVPRGWWHDGGVADDEAASGNLRLQCCCEAVTGRTLLRWLGDRLAACEPFRRDIPLMAGDVALAEYLSQIKRLLNATLRESSPGRLRTDLLSGKKERGAMGLGESLAPWSGPAWNDHRVALRGFDHATLDAHADEVRLVANGRTHTLDPRCLGLLRPLLASREVAVHALKAVDPDEFPAEFVDDFLKVLIEAGIVVAKPLSVDP